jgi:hypothetical protein
MPRARKTTVRAPARRVTLLIATRKGLWTLVSDTARRGWKLAGPTFLGHIVHHGRRRSARRQDDAGRRAHRPPRPDRFPLDRSRQDVEGGDEAARVPRRQRPRRRPHVLASPAHASEPHAWYAGTSPQGLFRSDDDGATWRGVDGFNEHRDRKAWCGGDQDGTPDGPKLHSILVDPRDPKHLYIAMSSGGVFESVDGGGDWKPLNHGVRADFLPQPTPEFGHDPHCVRLAAGQPDRLYQQNHCGLYRLDRPQTTWQDIGVGMPKATGAIGFRSSFIRATPTRCGCSRWTAPTSGRVCLPVAGPPCIGRATRARPGSGRIRDCPSRRRGGRSSDRR